MHWVNDRKEASEICNKCHVPICVIGSVKFLEKISAKFAFTADVEVTKRVIFNLPEQNL